MNKKFVKTCVLLLAILSISFSSVFVSDAASASDLSDFLEIPLMLPGSSEERSDLLAIQMLFLCSGHTKEKTARIFDAFGYEILDQVHYEKDSSDPAHNCAFTIGRGTALRKGSIVQDVLLVSVRGTQGGEWYSNFDFCPYRREDSLFAENFLFCAEDVFLTLKEYLDPDSSQAVLICGYSRGAACANLLGMLVNEYLGPQSVYTYTFATPATIRQPEGGAVPENPFPECPNIFNHINPCDLIPELPASGWGFGRIGIDIILPLEDPELASLVQNYTDTICSISPSVTSYYEDRHSLTSSGTDSNGVTSFEMMLLLCDLLTGLSMEDRSENSLSGDPGTFDFETLLDPVNLNDFPDQPDSGTLIDSGILSENSDLYPLAEIWNELSENHYEQGAALLRQHFPNIYLGLLLKQAGR
ncbi:MAG: hypothetical protein IJ106_03030 [Parasporobacterium sp.]|nr:hypothetical protein [Parasporobacterium sp.]